MAASAMIARMAQRHSPSPTVSPSPPPPKGGIFHQGVPQGVPQRQLVAPPSGPAPVQLPGQVHGQIPGHIHGPMIQPHAPPNGQGPTPGQILGQTGQLPSQIHIHTPGGRQVGQAGPVMAPRAVTPNTQALVMLPQVQPVSSIGQMPQQGSYPMGEKQLPRTEVMQQQQQQAQGAPLQQPVPHPSQGENVSVADIIAGNMRVQQQQLNFGLQQSNGKPVNGQMGPAQVLNGPQNFVGTPTTVRSNVPVAPSLVGTVAQVDSSMPKGIPQNASVQPTVHHLEQGDGISVPTGNGQHHIQSDTNSESSLELNSRSKSRSRSNSGKSGRKTPSRQSSKSPSRGAEKASAEDTSTEKCKPPLKVSLPDGEVRIEKIPNMHAVGVDEDDEDAEDRTDLAEGIVRQIAGSPVLNQSSCDVPMDETESMLSEADTIEDNGSQTPKINGETSTPDLPQPQRMQGLVTTMPESFAHSPAGVFSQPQQAQVTQQYQLANSNTQPGSVGMVTQSQPQQQYVIQQQIPAQTVVSRGMVNVQMHSNQPLLQTQAGNMVQTHPVGMPAGTVVGNSQGAVIQTQGGNFVQVQPQIQMQGHQTVIHNQTNFQGQQFQTQVPLQVTLLQQPSGQGQVQQQVQQQQLTVVTGVQHFQPGQTMIMTNSKQQGNFAQATILSQNPGQLVVQNVSGPPRTGPKPILPQPPPVSTMVQGPRPILPQPSHLQGTQNFQIARPIQHHQIAQVQGSPQNVQIARFPGMQRLQGPLSPTNRDSPLIKRLLQQGPALQAAAGQQQLQVIQPQQGQIVLNAIGQSQGAPMTVQTQGQPMPLSHVQVVTQFSQGMTVQSAPTIANIPQIQLHHQPILPAPPGTTSPNMNMKDTKSKKNHKSKHKKKDKDKDKERDKNKNGGMKDDQSKFADSQVAANGEKESGKGYSVNVISEDGDKKVVGVVCNGLPVPVGSRTDANECNNSVDSLNQDTKQGLANGYMNDKLHSGIKLAKDGIASKDIESLLKKTPQTIGDKVDSVVEQMKRDKSSSAENGIIADKLGKPCLNHVMNGDIGSHTESPLHRDPYDSNNTVSDRLDKLFYGAVPNLSQPNIPNASTPNPKSLVAFCHEIRPSFPSTVPSVTVGAVANANNNNQQNSCQSVPLSTSRSGDTQTNSAASNRTQSSVNQTSVSEATARAPSASSQVATSAPPASTTSAQSSLPLPAQQPPSPLTVQVPSPSTASPCFKRPIDDVLLSPDSKQSVTSNPAASPTTPAPTPPSPSTPRSSKKRRHSSSSSTSSSSRKSSSTSGKSAPVVQKYVCEWKGCSR